MKYIPYKMQYFENFNQDQSQMDNKEHFDVMYPLQRVYFDVERNKIK